MRKRGRGVSTRLRAISLTFKDGLITMEDKARLKDLLLLGDSSLEDALDGVLSGDRTKILGYLLYEEPDQRLRAESARFSATRMRFDSAAGIMQFASDSGERLSKSIENATVRLDERKDSLLFSIRSSGSSLHLDDLNLDELLQSFDLEHEAIGSFDLQRSSLEAIRDALDMYDQQLFADKENDTTGMDGSAGLAGSVETDSAEAILSQIPFGLFPPSSRLESVPEATDSEISPLSGGSYEYEHAMPYPPAAPAYGRSRSCDSEQRQPTTPAGMAQKPLPKLLNRRRHAMSSNDLQHLTGLSPPSANPQHHGGGFVAANGTPMAQPQPVFQQQQFHFQQTPQQPPAVPQRPLSMPLNVASQPNQFGMMPQQQPQQHRPPMFNTSMIPQTPAPCTTNMAPQPTPFLQQFASMPGFSQPQQQQQQQPQAMLPPPVPHYQQLAMHFLAGNEAVASAVGVDKRRSYKSLAPAPPSGLAGYMSSKLTFTGGVARPAFSAAGANMAWLTGKLNQDIIQLVARGNINEQDRAALIRLGMNGDGYLRSKLTEAVREALQMDTTKLTSLLCIGQNMFHYRHTATQQAQNVYSSQSEADASEASSVSSVTAESLEMAKRTAKLSQEIALIEQQIVTKKEEVIQYRSQSDMDKAVEKMRELKYLESCANDLRRQSGILPR